MAAGPGRPFECEGIAGKIFGMAISFEGPSGDDFTARLANFAEFDERRIGLEAGFFDKLPLGGI